MNRRNFLQALSAIGCSLCTRSLLAAKEDADKRHGPLRIESIEPHTIMTPYHDWIAYQLNHFYGPSSRTIYVVKTNTGLTGLGESGSPESTATLQKYIGTSPFDWIGDETSLGLATAMYDLMGKAAGVPVYKLFGQQYRKWVRVASWTVSTHPTRMAQAVKEYSRQGYTWMKYHLSPFENVFDQLDAMQAVAPKGFKINFDLTMGGTTDHMPELLNKIAKYPIAGAFEDPLNEKDIDGYIELRKRINLPIVLHHSPLGFTFDVVRRAADAYIVGHAKIGDAVRHAGAFSAANAPFMLQNVGGNITRCMTVHMHSAFKTATFPFQSDTETWKDDVVKDRLKPVNGLLRVPNKPGLGLTIDEEALQRLKALKLPQQPKWIIKTSFKNGSTMYNIADPKKSIFMVRPDYDRLLPMSYASPLKTEYWDDDGTAEYKAIFARIKKDGVVLERNSNVEIRKTKQIRKKNN